MREIPRLVPEGACREDRESGFILIALLASVLPLVLIVSASISTMTGRNKALLYDIRQTRALLAAEAGVDEAVYRAANGALNSGVPFTVTVGNGVSCTVEPTHFMSDGVDNDMDGNIDEFDENVFELIITATYRDATRRIAAYLGPLADLPAIDGAITVSNNNVEIDIEQEDGFDPFVTGDAYHIDGTRDDPTRDVEGLTIEDPGTVAHLLSEMSAYEQGRVFGRGGTPSLAQVSNGYDFDAIAEQAQNTANIVLSSKKHTNPDWGNAELGEFNIIFRDGDVEVFGGRGAGILVATGEIELEDGFRWDGLIISTHGDELELESDAGKGPVYVYGAMVVGPDCEELELEGDVHMYYCPEILQTIGLLVPSSRYVSFNGWQEISIYDADEDVVYVPPVIGAGTAVEAGVVFGSGAVVGGGGSIKENCTFGDNLNVGNNPDILMECVFGNNVTVGNGCQIKEYVVMGDDVTVGNNVTIGKNCVVGNGATVTNGSDVPDGTNIPAGATY